MVTLNTISGTNRMLLTSLLASGILVSVAAAQSASPAGTAAAKPGAPGAPSRYQPERIAGKAARQYGLIWGIDAISAKLTESGEVVRFSYRVLDADKAKALNDKKNEPALIDPRARVRLVVPHLPFVGQMRQSAAPEPGKSYWVAFSNKGGKVKRGDRVSVLIGAFHADGLVVQ